jgi:hypothetical protein
VNASGASSAIMAADASRPGPYLGGLAVANEIADSTVNFR